MSLNPSNGIAARTNPGTMFPNLARHDEEVKADPSIALEVDWICASELALAGIEAPCYGLWKPEGEVPSSVRGFLDRWGFTRAWYYWVAKGSGIPPDIAQEFWTVWGKQVRTEGDCTCPSPYESCKGFAVGSYHIDTQEGLTAFAGLLRSIHCARGKVQYQIPPSTGV